jgi:multiple sugar transport system substrate-binding protein
MVLSRATRKASRISRLGTAAFCVLSLYLLAGLQFGCARRPPVTLRLAGDEWFLNSLTKANVIPAFEQQTGIHINVVPENDRAILAALDRGSSGGALDIIVVRHRLLGALVEKHQVREIDSFLADSKLHDASFNPQQELFPDWWRELSSYRGHTYGYPFTGLTAYLCYRKDLLHDPANQREFKARYHHDLKAPATWEEFLQLAEFFNRPKDHFYGTYIQGKQGPALWYEWLNYIYSFGGNILDTQHGWEYGDIVVNSPANVAATEQYVKAIRFSPPDTLKFGWGQAQSALQQGKVFMGILWSDQAPFLEDPKASSVAGKIGYSLIPSATGNAFSQMEGLSYLIPTESHYPQEAYRFLEWAMSTQVQEQQTLHGSSSILKSVYGAPAVQALPYTAAFVASVPVARPKPTVPESEQMIDASERRLFEIVSGQRPAHAGLDALALDLQRILGRKARLRYPVKVAP